MPVGDFRYSIFFSGEFMIEKFKLHHRFNRHQRFTPTDGLLGVRESSPLNVFILF